MDTQGKVLVVEDDQGVSRALCNVLEGAGYEIEIAYDGLAGLEAFAVYRPDLVILDVMMPRLDGIETCARLRQVDPDVAVLMLTARGDIDDKEAGFVAGADDYLTKPFDMKELLLRVGAHVRRRGRARRDDEAAGHRRLMQPSRIGDLVVDPLKREVAVGGRSVALTPTEFQIVALMADHPGKAFTKDELIEAIWGDGYDKTTISIPVYVRHIREKIERDPAYPEYLQTVWRYGYRLGDGV